MVDRSPIEQIAKVARDAFGPNWQTPLARYLRLRDPSSVRKLVSRSRPVPAWIRDQVDVLERRAKWSLGYGEDGGEYLCHLVYPRFTARVYQDGRDPDLDYRGVTMEIEPGLDLGDFTWTDPISDKDELVRLRNEAAAAIEIITADDNAVAAGL